MTLTRCGEHASTPRCSQRCPAVQLHEKASWLASNLDELSTWANIQEPKTRQEIDGHLVQPAGLQTSGMLSRAAHLMGLTGACPAVCMPGRSLLMICAAHCCTISQRSCRCVSVVPRARSCRMALLY